MEIGIDEFERPWKATDPNYNKNIKVYCDQCYEDLIFKNCVTRKRHFSHKGNSKCVLRTETKEHLEAKHAICRMIENAGYSPICECGKWKEIRPDVYLKYPKGNNTFQDVGFEIQRSDISIEQVKKRTEMYRKLGVYIIWVFTERIYKKLLKESNFTLPDFVEYIKNMFWGNIYIIMPEKTNPLWRFKVEESYQKDGLTYYHIIENSLNSLDFSKCFDTRINYNYHEIYAIKVLTVKPEYDGTPNDFKAISKKK